MADFVILPPRPVLGDQIARIVRSYLPGIEISSTDAIRFIESLCERQNNTHYYIHREDLPEDQDLYTALSDGFGAEPTDRIVQVGLGSRPEEPRMRMLSPVVNAESRHRLASSV